MLALACVCNALTVQNNSVWSGVVNGGKGSAFVARKVLSSWSLCSCSFIFIFIFTSSVERACPSYAILELVLELWMCSMGYGFHLLVFRCGRCLSWSCTTADVRRGSELDTKSLITLYFFSFEYFSCGLV